jgi:hypothetical protein
MTSPVVFVAMMIVVVVLLAIASCLISASILLLGLFVEGPDFYNGKECRMTYSNYQFLPLRVVVPDDNRRRRPPSRKDEGEERYRLLKFADARDPRHAHLTATSGSMVEDYESSQRRQSLSSSWRRNDINNHRRRNRSEEDDDDLGGRLLELSDNWCLLSSSSSSDHHHHHQRDDDNDTTTTTTNGQWTNAPHPHRGHPVLYVPGHWGSYSQSRSLGAHGTRWTGQHHTSSSSSLSGRTTTTMSDRDVHESLRTGRDMNDGRGIRPPPMMKKKNDDDDDTPSSSSSGGGNATSATSAEDLIDWLSSLSSSSSSSSSSRHHHHHHPNNDDRHHRHHRHPLLDGFVMDVYALDFDGQGAALHPSTIFRQADFFARAVRTIVEGCRLPPPPPPTDGGGGGIGIGIGIDDDDDGRKLSGGGGGGITIVAHSVGALVVRTALKTHPRLSKDGWIRNVIALASPLGSDFPYAVDAGVHDVVARLIDDDDDDDGGDDSNIAGGGGGGGDVTMISISGGLRDEMIPPEACQVPPPIISNRDDDRRNNKIDSRKASEFVSSAFLASSVMRGGGGPSSTEEDIFGMDHRAIVWCYDLLCKVRELIFSLVVATDNGLVSSERMDVAVRMMYGVGDGVGIDPQRNQSDTTVYQEQVNEQHVHLLLRKGYLRTVSIQLSAPYYLNSLLKLCIAAALLDTFAIFPSLQYARHGRTFSSIRKSKSLTEAFFDMALSLLAIPSLVVMVTWVRQSGPWRSCFGQECQLLLGTIFILSQLATLVYFVIVRGVCPFVAAILSPRVDFAHAECPPTRSSFWGILIHLIMEQLRMLTLIILPLTGAACFMINTFIVGTDDLAWNDMSIASYCYISFILHNLIFMVILATKSPLMIEHRRGEIFVLFLSLLKATLGTVLYALSLTTHWGQRDLDSYYDFLTAMNISSGFIPGRSNVMIISALTIVLPSFLAITVFRTHEMMTQISLFHWSQTKQKACYGYTANGATNIELESASKVMIWSYESTAVIIVQAFLTCWFTWTASVNIATDDLVVPTSVVIMTCLRCVPFSAQVIDVCSAVINNDLSLRSDSPQHHEKHQ